MVRQLCCLLAGLIAACSETHEAGWDGDAATDGHVPAILAPHFDARGSAPKQGADASNDSGVSDDVDTLANAGASEEDPGFPVVPLDAGPCQLQMIQPTTAEIREQTVSCTHALAVPASYPQSVSVTVAGRRRTPGDIEDGWRLESDNSTVVLLGAACDDVRAGNAWEIVVLCVHPISI
jgi:hypothetical protein